MKYNLLKDLENKLNIDIVQPDAFAVLQSIKIDTSITYIELTFLAHRTNIWGDGTSIIEWVVDTYPKISKKNAEQKHWEVSVSGSLEKTTHSEIQKTKELITNSKNSAQFKNDLSKLF